MSCTFKAFFRHTWWYIGAFVEDSPAKEDQMTSFLSAVRDYL